MGDSIVVDDVALDIGFDADEGEDWRAEIVTTGLDTPEASAAELHLTATGLLSPEAVTAAIDFATTDLALADSGLQAPLGSTPSGTAQIEWAQGDR